MGLHGYTGRIAAALCQVAGLKPPAAPHHPHLFRRIAHAIAELQTAVAFGDGSGGDTCARAALFQRQIVALMKQRTWHAPDVPLLPYTGCVFVSKKIGRLLNWLQVLLAFACVALSVMRLLKRDFAEGKNMRRRRQLKNMLPK